MFIGYMRVSKQYGSQYSDLQRDALLAAGVKTERFFEDLDSDRKGNRPGLQTCLKGSATGKNTLVAWKLDQLGRNLKHLINTVDGLRQNNIGFRGTERCRSRDRHDDFERETVFRHICFPCLSSNANSLQNGQKLALYLPEQGVEKEGDHVK